jgi:RNA polymerase sigma factor (sigma-70 family)
MDETGTFEMLEKGETPVPAGSAGHDWEAARRTLIFYFSRRGRATPEDLAQETITRVVIWLQGESHAIEGPDGFMKAIYGFARNVLLEDNKRSHTIHVDLSETLAAESNKTLGLSTLEASRLLTQLLDKLPEDERTLIMASEKVPQDELARQRSVSVGTLRVSLHRVREKLRRALVEHDSRGEK